MAKKIGSVPVLRVLVGFLAAITLVSVAQGQSAATAGLAGKWHFVFATDGGDREFDADFVVSDGKVSGTFGKDQVKGTADGEKFNLEFPVESEEAGKGILKMNGKVATEELNGSWSFQAYDGQFKATRPKPKTAA